MMEKLSLCNHKPNEIDGMLGHVKLHSEDGEVKRMVENTVKEYNQEGVNI